jgi:hypothetical protein
LLVSLFFGLSRPFGSFGFVNCQALIQYSNSVFAQILLNLIVNLNQLSRCLAPSDRVPSFRSCPMTTSVTLALFLYALILLNFDANLLLTLPPVLQSTLVPSLRWFRPVLVLSRDKPPIKSPFLSRTAVIASRGLSFVAISMAFCTSKVFQFQAAKGKFFRNFFFITILFLWARVCWPLCLCRPFKAF